METYTSSITQNPLSKLRKSTISPSRVVNPERMRLVFRTGKLKILLITLWYFARTNITMRIITAWAAISRWDSKMPTNEIPLRRKNFLFPFNPLRQKISISRSKHSENNLGDGSIHK